MFQRIFVPLDGSSRAEGALSIVARIARASEGSVLLAHVVDNSTNVWAYPVDTPLLPHKFLEEELADAERYLKNVATSPVFTGIKVETVVPFGSAASTLLSVASSSQADLIVLCSHGYTRMTRWILGSTAEYIVRHAAMPVLLLREGSSTFVEHGLRRPTPFRALVPLDGSAHAETALVPATSLVVALATPTRGEIHLLQVVTPETFDSTQAQKEKVQNYLSTISERIQEDLGTSEPTYSTMNITHSVVVDSDVVETIVETAELDGTREDANVSDGYDVIVMATAGRKGLQWWMMGSVTEGVLNMTMLPLLIVRSAPNGKQEGEALQSADGSTRQELSDEEQVAENAMLGKKEFPLMRPGAIYPDNYIMAVFKDEEKAEDAVQALLQAGISSEDIRLFESHETLNHAENTEKNKSLLSRITDVFQAVTSDEDQHVLIYVEEARRGHAILNVHVPKPQQVKRVKDILVAHSARNIKYFGRWSISILHH